MAGLFEEKPSVVKKRRIKITDLYPSLLDACGRDDTTSVDYFLSRGLDVNHVDKEGRFALLVASSFGKVEMVRFLLEHGANVDLLNSRKEPLVFKGKDDDFPKVAQLLQDHGAKEHVLSREVTTAVPDCSSTQSGSSAMSTLSSSQRIEHMELREALKALLPMASEWMDIGVMLGVPPHKLDMIRCDRRSSRDCLTELLSTWLKQTDPSPTWNDLIEAVKFIDPYQAEKIYAVYFGRT